MAMKHALLLALLPFAYAQASEPANPAPQDPTDDPLVIAAGFLNAHPDLQYRMYGLEAYKAGRHEKALAYFKRASFFADKPSQGMVAEMYWNGQGQPQDRVQAYIWMDLAAERGYTGFLGLRERYWTALDEAERALAIEMGQEVYARFGDAASKPRMAATLRRAAKRMTGSRTGRGIGNLQVIVPGPGGTEMILDGTKFYDPRYWDPEEYQKWQDSVWAHPRIGRVSVGELESIGTAAQSRVPATEPDHDAEAPELPPDADEPDM
ncbi:sel1 repeat family protein [Luteimonas terricola]|uniref:Sel1 repeat family protein n=1 Tax=Luteimonas terricola TaxID=645597 RepID=A0ABQ2E7P5_9GAMM|nr:sel1 repeat family protein [Luteimonas terricola]GGJ96359.1 hypothetical protein GCM10011394_01460 [Luteimonas terricola]